MKDKESVILGFGINDAGYPLAKYEELPKVNGKRKAKIIWYCPYYRRWKSMIDRCYSEKALNRMQCYVGCIVSEEWRRFSDFKKWVDEQPEKDWNSNKMHLDKDFLFDGNKVYSPDTCIFIPSWINVFTTDRSSMRGDCMLGVTKSKRNKSKPYISRCHDPLKRKEKNRVIGNFATELEAHNAWKERKHQYALDIINSGLVSDERLIQSLKTKYKPDTIHL